MIRGSISFLTQQQRHNAEYQIHRAQCSQDYDAVEETMNNCDACVNYVYDEEYECYCCMVNLDEDEMYRFLTGTQQACPYFQLNDEYGIVRHQN